MAAKKKLSEEVQPTQLDTPVQVPPSELLLRKAQYALKELMESGDIGSITRWEFNRQRSHRSNAKCVSSLMDEINALLGPCEVDSGAANLRHKDASGVRFNPE